MGVKLSDIIAALHDQDDMKKLAEDAGAAAPAGGGSATESPVSAQVGETIEDEKAKIQTKLMELAGLQEESVSAAKPQEELNTAQEAPAGEKVAPDDVNPAASASAPEEMATVVASVLSKMQPEPRKLACVKIVEKIASIGGLKKEDIDKMASAKFQEAEAIGRIMARSYHDEMQKIAAEVSEGETPEEPAEKKASGEAPAAEITAEDLKLLESLT